MTKKTASKRPFYTSEALKSRSASFHDLHVLGACVEIARLRALAVQLDLQAQVVHRIGVAQDVFVGDRLALVEVEQALVEGLHAELARALHDLLDLGDLALEDQVGDERRVEQDLDRRDAPLTLLARQEALRHQALQ